MTRAEHIRRLAADSRVSRDPRRHWPALNDLPEHWPLNVWVKVTSAFTAYGDEHRRLRRLIAGAFTPRRTEALRPAVRATVTRLIEDLSLVEPGRTIDLRTRFTYMIPTEVISDLFGVPQHMRAEARRVIDAALATAADPEQAGRDYADLWACMAALVAHKREAPGQDMTTDLIRARDGESRLTEDELISTLILMIGAGSETTVNLIGHAVVALLTHPDQHAMVRQGRISWDTVIEETLRWQGPIMHMPLRYAVEDIDLDGVTIPKGDAILLAFGAAGRDPDLHDHPATFDLTRSNPGDHTAFGHGAHYCPGAPLARMEAAIALPALFARFPRLALATDPDLLVPQESFIANGHRELPVTLH
ncbi:cytochrome P450 [Streptomyces calidiresistens]|uniref:cytochrome P450 family protein n=1 Tax=Streptomyces calidiresistens TaxID=1485586 RepID=UPI002B214B00|nr:cytochrome P450 [Streptomyces calidiresistens]